MEGYGAAPMAPPLTFKDGLLSNSAGMTVYTFDRDTAGTGKSSCNDACAAKWPPVMATTADSSDGAFTIVVRDDGRRQWAYKGKPVYTWVADMKPGDKTGDGVNQMWHTVPR
jgi:predicted lipoprotein with Yx(FWY)xxD motif